MTYTTTAANAELERLLASAKAAQELAANMLATKTEIDGGMEAVARGVADAGKAAELTAKRLQDRDLVKRVMSLGGVEREGLQGGDLFSEEAKTGIVRATKTRTAYRTEIPSKALLTTGAMLPPTGSGIEPGPHPNSQFPLATLFTNQPAEGPVQRYYRTTSGSAAVVAEGAAKPDSGVVFTAVDLALSKLACTANYSTEMEQDAGFLVQSLGLELQAAVAAAENKLILDTFATTSGVLTGTGALTAVVDLVADAVASQEAISGITPAAIVAHPNVIASIRKSKASTSGTYNVDILSTSPAMLHGVQLVSTPAAAAGTAWVVCPTGVVIYRRGPITVEVGTDGTDFSHNTQTARAEERVAAAVTRPSSLYKLVLT